MGRETKSRNVCDRCGTKDEWSDFEFSFGHREWADCQLGGSPQGFGNMGDKPIFLGLLCPKCKEIVAAALKPPSN